MVPGTSLSHRKNNQHHKSAAQAHRIIMYIQVTGHHQLTQRQAVSQAQRILVTGTTVPDQQ
jgi:hypothetical protein